MPAIPAPIITTGFAAASAISAFTPRVDEPFVCKASKNVYCRAMCCLQPDYIRLAPIYDIEESGPVGLNITWITYQSYESHPAVHPSLSVKNPGTLSGVCESARLSGAD